MKSVSKLAAGAEPMDEGGRWLIRAHVGLRQHAASSAWQAEADILSFTTAARADDGLRLPRLPAIACHRIAAKLDSSDQAVLVEVWTCRLSPPSRRLRLDTAARACGFRACPKELSWSAHLEAQKALVPAEMNNPPAVGGVDREACLASLLMGSIRPRRAIEMFPHDKPMVMLACWLEPWVFNSASTALLGDREIALAVVERHGLSLRDTSEEVRDDREVVLRAAQNNGVALEFASARLRDDLEIVLCAVGYSGIYISAASERARGHREVALTAVRSWGTALKDVDPVFREDKEVVVAAVANSSEAYRLAGPALRADIEVSAAFYQTSHREEEARLAQKRGGRGWWPLSL